MPVVKVAGKKKIVSEQEAQSLAKQQAAAKAEREERALAQRLKWAAESKANAQKQKRYLEAVLTGVQSMEKPEAPTVEFTPKRDRESYELDDSWQWVVTPGRWAKASSVGATAIALGGGGYQFEVFQFNKNWISSKGCWQNESGQIWPGSSVLGKGVGKNEKPPEPTFYPACELWEKVAIGFGLVADPITAREKLMESWNIFDQRKAEVLALVEKGLKDLGDDPKETIPSVERGMESRLALLRNVVKGK